MLAGCEDLHVHAQKDYEIMEVGGDEVANQISKLSASGADNGKERKCLTIVEIGGACL